MWRCAALAFSVRSAACVIASVVALFWVPPCVNVYVHRVAVHGTAEQAGIVHRAVPERGFGLCRLLAGLSAPAVCLARAMHRFLVS